jgi:uncharacterized alkaline shock family protein YloU/CBS domain-containing protein
MSEAIIVNDGQPPDTTNDRQIPTITFLDDARSEIAKIGAQGVKGVRVVSAEVKEQDADVHLVVDVEYRKDLSQAIKDVQNKVSKNLERHLPNGKGHQHQVNVTVANVLSPTSDPWNKAKNFLRKVPGFLKSEVGPWIVPVLFVGLGVAILWTITSWVNDKNTTLGDVVLALLLVMPILIYALISGRLTELRGPGGVEAKFTGVATRPVAETASHDLVSFNQQQLAVGISEGDKAHKAHLADTLAKRLEQRVRRFTEVQPIVMTITIGLGSEKPNNTEGSNNIEDSGHRAVLRKYVEQLARTRNFALVAFLDTKKDFVAYMPSRTIQNRLLDHGKREELFQVIEDDNREKLLEYPGVVRDKISPNTTNGEALRKMVTSNLDVIVVVDENNRLKGVVEREQVLARMVLTLTPNG